MITEEYHALLPSASSILALRKPAMLSSLKRGRSSSLPHSDTVLDGRLSTILSNALQLRYLFRINVFADVNNIASQTTEVNATRLVNFATENKLSILKLNL